MKNNQLRIEVNRIINKEANYKKQIENLNKAEEKLLALTPKYKDALSKLDASIAQGPILFNDNVCVQPHYQNWVPIQKRHFRTDLSDKEKSKAYSIIKKYLCIHKEIGKYSGQQTPTPPSPSYIHLANGGMSESVISFLYELTTGNKDILIEFAKLCAHICKKGLLRSPIVILADKSLHATLKYFIEQLVLEVIPETSLSNYLENQFITSLFVRNLNFHFLPHSSCAAIITEGKIPETELSVKKLTDLMTGRQISITHPSFSSNKLYVKNELQFVFITEKHETYLKLKNIYGAKGIKISTMNSLSFKEADAEWFRSCFSGLGEKWIRESPKTTFLPKITEDDIFDHFVGELCMLKDDAECPKAVLYDAYVKFYSMYYGNKPMSQITFSKRFACYGNFETTRPHSSRTESYRYCFKGIDINKEKYAAMQNTVSSSHYVCSREVFKAFMCKLMENDTTKPIISLKTIYT